MAKKHNPKFVLVTWEDAFYDDGVHSVQELEQENEQCLLHSAGHLVRETDIIVTIAMDYDETNDNFRRIQRIRKENIREMRVVE